MPMSDNGHIQQAMAALESDHPEECYAAIELLGKAQHRAALPYLIDLLRDGEAAALHFAVVVALGNIGDSAPLPELLAALRGDDMWIRVAVIGALIKIGPPSVPGLIEAARDDNKAVRRAAAKALGKIGDEAAVPVLSQALSDADSAVRQFAAQALERLGVL
jgi:HEAT repeat protein